MIEPRAKDIVPQNDQVLLEIEEKEEIKTESGIIIQAEDKKKDWHGVYGTVIAVGAKVSNRAIKVGRRVVVNRYDGIDFRVNTTEYRLIKGELIFAIVKE